MIYDVVIIGAGLAGCSAAIQLAELGFQVLLLEQQRYPTHKLCGEFLSVEVIAIFERLGVLAAVQAAGAVPICHTSVSSSSGEVFHSQLPGTALGLSRYQLDLILMQRAAALGATCHDGTTVQAVTGDLSQGFVVSTRQDHFTARMVIGAYGKRSSLDRSLGRSFVQRPSPFVAFKAHYTGLELPSVVELHAFPGGYCGLSQIEAGRINVCGIAHEAMIRTAVGETGNGTGTTRRVAFDHHHPVLSQNSALAERLQALQVLPDTAQSLSQITFELKGKFDHDLWMMGDTAGMIAPLCGDGMAMALRSAEIAVPLAAKFLQGKAGSDRAASITDLKRNYTRQWNQEFRTRLQLGRYIHHSFIHPAMAHWGVRLCDRIPALGDMIIRATRSTQS